MSEHECIGWGCEKCDPAPTDQPDLQTSRRVEPVPSPPTCKTCGGSKRIPDPRYQGRRGYVDCPDCTSQGSTCEDGERVWLFCPVCAHGEFGSHHAFAPPVVCVGFERRGTSHPRTPMIAAVPASALTEAQRERDEARSKLDGAREWATDLKAERDKAREERDVAKLTHSECHELLGEARYSLAQAQEALRERQEGIDKALSALHSSAYVGGPTEREAWQTVLRELGPFGTQHQGAALPPSTEEPTGQEEGQG